jgi:O-antigen/teichoic acid export membrane protein
MFLIPSAFGLSVLAKTLLNVLTTPEFIPGLFVVPIVAFGAVMFCFFQISIFIVHLVHKTAITIKLLIVSALLNVILNIILVPLVGIVGAAIATLIAYSVLGILTIIVTQKDIKYDLSLPFLVISTFSAAVMALIIWLINPTNIIMILITILIGIIIYFCMLLLLRAFTEEEMKHMNKYKNAISRRINAFFLGSCMRVTVFRNAKYKGHIFKTKKEL